MKRYMLGLTFGALACLAFGDGARAVRAQEACESCAPAPGSGHPALSRLCQLAHTPHPPYRPTHYTDWFWRNLGQAMTGKHPLQLAHSAKAAECAPAPVVYETAPAQVAPEGYYYQAPVYEYQAPVYDLSRESVAPPAAPIQGRGAPFQGVVRPNR